MCQFENSDHREQRTLFSETENSFGRLDSGSEAVMKFFTRPGSYLNPIISDCRPFHMKPQFEILGIMRTKNKLLITN